VGTTRLWRQNTKEVVDLIEAAENRQRTGEAGIIELANGELLYLRIDLYPSTGEPIVLGPVSQWSIRLGSSSQESRA